MSTSGATSSARGATSASAASSGRSSSSPARSQVDYVFRAFQLDPTASPGKSQPVVEAYAKKFGGPERAQVMIDRVTSIAADEGLEFRLDRALRANTLLAHRLLWLAEQPGLAGAAGGCSRSACCRRTSTTGSTSAIPTCSPTAPPKLGFDRDAVRRTSSTRTPGLREVRADIEQAIEFGITGGARRSWSTAVVDPGCSGHRHVRQRASGSCRTASSSRRRRCAKTTSAMSDRRLVFLHGFTQTHHHWHACAQL